MAEIPFGKPYPHVDPVSLRDGTAAELLNGYIDESGSYRRRPGLTLIATHGDADTINSIYQTLDGTILVVTNGKVAKLNVDMSFTNFTGDAIAENQCRWAETASFVYLAHSGHLAKINVGAQTVQLLDGVGGSPLGPAIVTHVVASSGYILTNGGSTGTVHYSDDEGVTWEFFNAETVPDSVQMLMEDRGEVWAFGPRSVEAAFEDGVTPWAFAQGSMHPYGSRNNYTDVMIDGSIYWLGNYEGSPKVMRMKNRVAEPISGPYDQVIADWDDTALCKAWGIMVREQPFYLVTFSTEYTLAYNIRQDHWSRWTYDNSGTHEVFLGDSFYYCRHPSIAEMYLVGDRRQNGHVYLFSGITDNEDLIRFELTSGHINRGTGYRKRCPRIKFRVKRGAAEDDSEPTFTWAPKDDNNPTFGASRTISLGLAGETNMFGHINRCGSYRTRQHKITCTHTKSDFVFVGADEDYEVMR